MASESGNAEWILNNWRTKLAAVLLAVIAWFAIDNAISNRDVISDLPLEIKTAEGLAVLNRSVDKVDVTFRGAREDIRQLKREDISVEIVATTSQIELKPEHVKGSGRCRVVSLDPHVVNVELDREGYKTVEVEATTEDELPKGYVLKNLTASPTNATIYGPVSRLADVKMIRTIPISLKGRNGTFRERTLLAAPSNMSDARMEPEKVMVEAVIIEFRDEKTIESVPVTAMVRSGSRHSVRIDPSHVKVSVTGGGETLKEIDVTRISAYVDCSAMTPGSSSVLPVKVVPVSGIVVDLIQPDVVNVEMSGR